MGQLHRDKKMQAPWFYCWITMTVHSLQSKINVPAAKENTSLSLYSMMGGVSPRMTSRNCNDHPQNSNFKLVNKDFDNPFQDVINILKGKKTPTDLRALLYQLLWSWTRQNPTLSPLSTENYTYSTLTANGQNWLVKKPFIQWAFNIFMNWALLIDLMDHTR